MKIFAPVRAEMKLPLSFHLKSFG